MGPNCMGQGTMTVVAGKGKERTKLTRWLEEIPRLHKGMKVSAKNGF